MQTENIKIGQLINIQLHDYIIHIRKTNDSKDSCSGLDNTTRGYLCVVKEFHDFILANNNINEEAIRLYDFRATTFDDIVNYSRYICEVKKNKVSTHNQKIRIIKSFLQYLLDTAKTSKEITNLEELTKQMYLIELPVVAQKKYYFTIDDISKLHSFIIHNNSKRKERLLALFLLYRDTISKRDDIRLLNIDDVHLDVDNPYVEFKSDTSKRKGIRKCYLRPDTVDALKEYIPLRRPKNPEDNALFISNFGIRISTSTVYKMFKNLYWEAGYNDEYDLNSLRLGISTEINANFGATAIRNITLEDAKVEDSIFNYELQYKLERQVD